MNGCARFCFLLVVFVMTRTMFAQATMNSLRAGTDVAPGTDPTSPFWRNAPYVFARVDTMGNDVGRRATEIRSRWTNKYLYFLFICPYDELYLNPKPITAAETNRLWNWDVAEVFIGSDFENIYRYKEFEISPQGEWVDLDIDLHKPHHEDGWLWNSGFDVSARIDPAAKIWFGTMRIPFAAITAAAPRPAMEFRMNLFRAEGPPPKRHLITWQAPMAPTFHTPERFGRLKLVDDADASNLAESALMQ